MADSQLTLYDSLERAFTRISRGELEARSYAVLPKDSTSESLGSTR